MNILAKHMQIGFLTSTVCGKVQRVHKNCRRVMQCNAAAGCIPMSSVQFNNTENKTRHCHI